MTVSEFAEKHGVPYQSAVRWARRGHIPGVRITQFGKFKVYMIPEDAKPPELPTGRPPLTDEEKAARAKKRAAKAASVGLPFEPPAPQPAKLMRGATRKARAKKSAKKASKKAGD